MEELEAWPQQREISLADLCFLRVWLPFFLPARRCGTHRRYLYAAVTVGYLLTGAIVLAAGGAPPPTLGVFGLPESYLNPAACPITKAT
jgi:hypothetical protein